MILLVGAGEHPSVLVQSLRHLGQIRHHVLHQVFLERVGGLLGLELELQLVYLELMQKLG